MRVLDLAAREGWQVDQEVVRLIVSRADGCVRDAETLLGQLGSLGETKINVALASLVIPTTHLPLAAGLMRCWARRDHGGALQEAHRLADEGLPILPLFDDLLTIARHLLQATAFPQKTEQWATGTAEERAMVPLSQIFSSIQLHDMALVLMERRKDVKGGVDPLFALELTSTSVIYQVLKQDVPIIMIPPPASTPLPTEPTVSVLAAEQVIQAPSAQEMEPVAFLDLTTVRMKWSAIVRAIDEKNHSLPFILKISQPHEVQGHTLIIRFQYPFHRDKVVTDMKNRRIVEECARAVLGVPSLMIEGVVQEDAHHAEERSQDMVTNILKAFGGQVVEG